MLIALDYDGTYTADPDGWDAVVTMMRERGHQFVCVTGRTVLPGTGKRMPIMPMICCREDEWKCHAATRYGFKVDVWIDDIPSMIGPTLKLDFSQ